MKKAGIIGIYLAAGNSRRFGGNKLLSQVGNYPLGSLGLKTALASNLDKLVVVTKETDELNWVSKELFSAYQKKWFHISCAESVHGQSNSLKCGVDFARNHHAEAILVMLADQPLISKKMINTIIRKYRHQTPDCTPVSFIASEFSGVICPPVLFHEKAFKDLDKLQGDRGARFYIRNRISDGDFVEFANPLLFFDVDTKEDYKDLLEQKCKHPFSEMWPC